MNTCVMCNQLLNSKLSFAFLFSFHAFKPPLICLKCTDKFTKINPKTACPGCSRPQLNQETCKDCKKWQKMYPQLQLNHTALFEYNDTAKAFMDQYKFQGDLLLADVFSEPIQKALQAFQKTHLIVPIPLSPLSKARRGFNQVELLLKRAGISYQQILGNETDGQLQSSKNRMERLQTPQPYHIIDSQSPRNSHHSPVIIVDDVYTTGRTILHARLLLENFYGGNFSTKSFSLFR